MAASSITRPSGVFTSYDFDSWLVELRNLVPTAFPGWTDYNMANIGNLILESFAQTLHVLSFKQGQQYLEGYTTFARLRRSMIALAKKSSFALSSARVASVDLLIEIADGLPRTRDIHIPAGTVITTPTSDVEFDTLADATIPAGSTSVTVSAENARAQQDSFVAPGTSDLPVPLGSSPYVDGTAAVVIGGDTYSLQENLWNSSPTDKHFFIVVDEEDRATARFGDGTNGAIPSGAGTISYKTGGGALGNVDANTLTKFRDGNRYSTEAGDGVVLGVRNPAPSAGGVDRMSVEEARVAIPASHRTTGRRSVWRTDYEDNAKRVRGVARALMLTADQDSSIEENRGKLYIVPVGGGLPSTALKNEVLNFILDEYPPTVTFQFTVEPPSLRVVSVVATVWLAKGVTESEARAAIESSLESLFSLILSTGAPNEQVDFGYRTKLLADPPLTQGEFPWSDIFNAVRDAANSDGALVLRKVEEDSFVPADTIVLTDTQFPILGSVQLINGATGLPF